MAERNKPGPDDTSLWKAVTRDVKPIKRKPAAKSRPEPAKAASQPTPKKTGAMAPARPVAVKPAIQPTRPPRELTHGRASDIDKRSLERLRRGQMPIEAEIDLHGHTLEAAHRVLNAFIAGHAAAGRRCVRVITGKGSFREGGGVLKTAVPRWLNEPPLQDSILAFSHARRDDGGEGALYVLLRRKRVR